MTVSSSQLIAVLGAGGPTGKLCVQQLLDVGTRVRAVVRSPATYKGAFAADPALEIVTGDVTDPESLSAALDGVTGIIFAASSSTYFGAKSVENEVCPPSKCQLLKLRQSSKCLWDRLQVIILSFWLQSNY